MHPKPFLTVYFTKLNIMADKSILAKRVLFISRILVGLVFIFSGFVKAIDPSGFAIKIEEYLLAFHMDFMTSLAYPLAIIQSSAEVFIGLNLIMGICLISTAWLLMLFMSFYTVLTFILALTNPVTDCGCFGDAIKLTNWQTFGKNVVLMFPTLGVFLNRKCDSGAPNPGKQLMCMVNFILPTLISAYCLWHQPILDFRPYKVGVNIPDGMKTPEGAPSDVYENTFIYKKDGIRKEFTEQNFPWQDTTWKWVETRKKLVSKGYEPPIYNFTITNSQGGDITDQVLADTSYVLLIVSPKLEHASAKGMQMMNEVAMKANTLGFRTYCLTSSTTTEIEKFTDSYKPVFEVCTSDETTLKTIVRANPGLLILKKGTILGKWNYRDALRVDEIQSDLISGILRKGSANQERTMVVMVALIALVFYALILKNGGKE
jgi:uncharacterized membrane protein YphA (DoxX/SURF4 family)